MSAPTSLSTSKTVRLPHKLVPLHQLAIPGGKHIGDLMAERPALLLKRNDLSQESSTTVRIRFWASEISFSGRLIDTLGFGLVVLLSFSDMG